MGKPKCYSRIIQLPFSGFYESCHDGELDQALEMMLADENGNQLDDGALQTHVHMDCHWTKVHEAYAASYVKGFANEYKIKLIFEKMLSPREYNFTTDRIFAYIPLSEVYRLRQETTPLTLAKIAKEKFTSRSGFIPFYSSVVEDWGLLQGWDHNQLGTLLEAWLEDYRGKEWDQDAEIDLMEFDRCNGNYENWISENTPNIDRLYHIREYLDERRKREGRWRPKNPNLRFMGAGNWRTR